MTLETKYRALEKHAMAWLTRPLEAPVNLDFASLIFLIWSYPSFEHYQSWALSKSSLARKEYRLVRRTTWDHGVDHERAAHPLKQAPFMIDPDPAPTIEVLDVRVDADFAARLVGRLGSLTVPSLLASRGVGIDGVVNGIETQHQQVRLEWWCDGPPDWRSLTEEV